MNKITSLIIFCSITLLLAACDSPPPVKTGKPHVLQNHGVHIDFTDSGNGDTTLLFVHGWCINKTYWDNQVALFRQRYRVVAIDLPGFGKSGKNRKIWTTEVYGADVDSAISQLNLKNVILVGHSMSGDIVLQAAINTPTKVIGLIGIDNFQSVGIAPQDPKKAKAEYAAAIDSLKHHFKATAFDYVRQDLFSKTTSSEVKQRVLNDVAHADTVIATACMQGPDFDEAAKLLQAKKKLYLINSDFHNTDTTGLVKKRIPYKLYLIHDSGHFPMVEQPERFNQLLAKAISDIHKK
jgi:pimeloyl-ACP methyl ester carboxylesterase